MGLGAADYALIGAFGGALICQFGNMLGHRHDRWLVTTAGRRDAYGSVVTAARVYRRRAEVAVKVSTDQALLDVDLTPYLDASRDLNRAIDASLLFSGGTPVQRPVEHLSVALADCSAWVAAASDGRLVAAAPASPRAPSLAEALRELDRRTDGFVRAAQVQLGIRSRLRARRYQPRH